MKINLYLIEFFNGDYSVSAEYDTFLGVNAYEAIGKLITKLPLAKIQNVAKVLNINNGEIE